MNADQNSEALKQIELAVATPNRLSARDSLLVDAWRSTLTPPGASLQKWKLVTEMYPDFYPASGPYSYFAWCNNRYTDAIAAAKLNVAPQNQNSSAGENLLGILYLAEEAYTQSAQWFQHAINSGYGRTDYAAVVYAAQRDFQRANDRMSQNKSPGISTIDRSTDIIRIAIAADQGHWQDVRTELVDAQSRAEKLGELHHQRLQGIALGLHSEIGEANPKSLDAYARAVAAIKTDNVIDTEQAKFHLLFATYLMAQTGEVKRAHQLLANMDMPTVGVREESALNNLRSIVTAELARREGRPQQAVDGLKPLVNGNELFLTHRTLLDAYASLGQNEAALAEAQWLAQHRGRAYAEYGANQFMMAFNVVQSDLALLRIAELSHDLGRQAESTQALKEFTQAWPNITVKAIAERRQALQH